MKIDDKKGFIFTSYFDMSHWLHEGNNNWSHWVKTHRPVPAPEFIKKQAKGQMKLYHGEIWEKLDEQIWKE